MKSLDAKYILELHEYCEEKNQNNRVFLIETYLALKMGLYTTFKGLLKQGKGRLPATGTPFPSDALRIRSNQGCVLHNEPSAR